MGPAGGEGRDDARRSLAVAVRDVLSSEARRNERRVGSVRLAGYSAVFVLDVILAIAGVRPAANVLQSVACTAVAGGLWVAVARGPFHPIYAWIIPLVDAGLIGGILSARIAQFGAGNGITATAALVCGLFTMVGAMRFQRPASYWATFLAAALLCVLLGPHSAPHELLYSLVALVTTGLLALWLTDLVRRSMEGAASRVLLQRFLPADLVRDAFDDPMATLPGPRVVDVTVLVSDLRGFTALCEGAPPQRIFGFLSELQGSLAAVVAEHGGTVDKFMGDGMLAVFDGADHAARAVAAARDIRRAVAALEARSLLGSAIRVGIGVHSGAVVAGYLGTGDRLEATIIGDTVNIASRLEALTKDHDADLVISAEVARRTGIAGRPLGALPIRGRVEAVEVLALDPDAA